MSNVIIFHGTDCRPEDFWYQQVKSDLSEYGHEVVVPYYEQINRLPIDEFITSSAVVEDFRYDSDTVLIGHSAGVPLILSILERIEVPIKQAILVAGFSESIGAGVTDPVLQASYDWSKIRKNANEFVIFNSPNDPWGCDDVQGRKLFDRLGGTLIIRNDGHFGSSKNPEYKNFPLLVKLVGGADEN
jgi:hypothetical protein